MILRLTDNVPSIYVDDSRDFQLLCRLYDSTNQEVKFNTITLLNALTASKLNNRMLKLLADRIGFKTNQYIDDKVLRYIIAAFPYIVKNKGTMKGIEQAVITVLKAENSLDSPYINLDSENHWVDIITPISLYNKKALEELLKYIIPAGYGYTITEGSRTAPGYTLVKSNESILEITSGNNTNFSIIRKDISLTDEEHDDYKLSKVGVKYDTDDSLDNLIGAVGTEIVGRDPSTTVQKGANQGGE